MEILFMILNEDKQAFLPLKMAYCIQCPDAISGKTGDFGYEMRDGKRVAITPVFSDLGEFYNWMHSQGYQSEPGLSTLSMAKS